MFAFRGVLGTFYISIFVLSTLVSGARPALAQSTSCAQSVVDTVNGLLDTPGANGTDTLRIDFDLAGMTQCLAVGGNARVAPQDTIEIGHCTTARNTDLCFVYDLRNKLTALSITGPGISGSPGDDTSFDLFAGVYFVTMTVNGQPSSFSFEVVELSADNQRLKSEPIAIQIGSAPAPALDVVKSAKLANGDPIPLNGVVLGDVIKYTYVLTNTGNVTFQNLVLADNHGGTGSFGPIGSCTLTTDASPLNDTAINGAGTEVSSIGALDVVTCEADYTVIQSDIDSLQ